MTQHIESDYAEGRYHVAACTAEGSELLQHEVLTFKVPQTDVNDWRARMIAKDLSLLAEELVPSPRIEGWLYVADRGELPIFTRFEPANCWQKWPVREVRDGDLTREEVEENLAHIAAEVPAIINDKGNVTLAFVRRIFLGED